MFLTLLLFVHQWLSVSDSKEIDLKPNDFILNLKTSFPKIIVNLTHNVLSFKDLADFIIVLSTFHDDFDADSQILPKTIIDGEERFHLELFKGFIHKLKNLLTVFELGLLHAVQQFLVFVQPKTCNAVSSQSLDML